LEHIRKSILQDALATLLFFAGRVADDKGREVEVRSATAFVCLDLLGCVRVRHLERMGDTLLKNYWVRIIVVVVNSSQRF
jgi:hypothetical protein